MLAFCLPANVYILPVCIIAGAFSRKDVCLIFVLAGMYQENCPEGPIHSQGTGSVSCIGWYDIWRSYHSIIPVASWYQEIHPYSVVNIDNVNTNTTSDERTVNFQTSAHGFMSKTWFSLIPDTRNTRWFWKWIGYGLGIEKYFGFGSGIGYPLVPAQDKISVKILKRNKSQC